MNWSRNNELSIGKIIVELNTELGSPGSQTNHANNLPSDPLYPRQLPTEEERNFSKILNNVRAHEMLLAKCHLGNVRTLQKNYSSWTPVKTHLNISGLIKTLVKCFSHGLFTRWQTRGNHRCRFPVIMKNRSFVEFLHRGSVFWHLT